MRRKILLGLSAVLLVGALGSARAAKLPLASEQQPPKYIDEAELVLYLMRRSDEGYAWRLSTWVYGVGSKSDAVRVEWVAKGKVVGDQRCALNPDGDNARLECDWEGKPLSASGDVTVNLIYVDDQTEKEYLLRTMNVRVAKFTWMKDVSYQILHDDNLGAAYAYHQVTDGGYIGPDHQVVFFFWMSDIVGIPKAQLRCTVNGKRIPDFDAALQSNGFDIEGLMHKGGDERRYHWTPVRMYPERLWFGTRDEAHKRFTDDDIARGETRILAELAGDWDCALRSDGNVVRQFLFKVNEQGRIAPSPAQAAPGFPKLPASVVWVDMRLPAKNAFDKRVRPDAMKKSLPYGLPWPKHEIFDAAKKALPPASGLADPS